MVLEKLEVCTVVAERLVDELVEVLRRELIDEVDIEGKPLELEIVLKVVEELLREAEALEELEVGGEGGELLEELLAELEDWLGLLLLGL